MSEKELDAILEELRTGKISSMSDSDEMTLQDALNGFNAQSRERDEAPKRRAKRPKAEAPKREQPKKEPLKAAEPVVEELAAPAPKKERIEKVDFGLVEVPEKKEAPADDKREEKPKKSKEKTKKDKQKKIVLIVVAIVLVIAVGVGAFFIVKGKNKEPEATTTKPSTTVTETTTQKAKGITNPLTGEEGFSKAALTQRPVAVVVENEYSSESVRPQWALADADIVLEGESEFSTRMLLFWADYTKVPSKVGPTRSARPPFIRFSQLFDSVFIHAGLSHTTSEYIGADTVFKSENVDHINLLNSSEDGKYFGRDRSRGGAVEHTGYLNGDNLVELLKSKKFRLTKNDSKFTTLSFNDEAQPLSANKADKVLFRWSTAACPKKGRFSYDSEKRKYTTTDFDSSNGKANVAWENLVFLLDTTEYITKHGYKGGSETYCNYKLSGGEGMVFSEGTYQKISWGVKNGKLWMKDETGKEIKLNPGKTYIGYGSSNHGGSITPNPTE